MSTNIQQHMPVKVPDAEAAAAAGEEPVVILPEDLNRKFDKIKMKIMMQPNSAFISHILFSLNHVWTNQIDKCTVSCERVCVNPEWFNDQTEEDAIYALIYVAWQVALQHVGRVGFRDIKKWNKASAIVINNMLEAAGYNVPHGYMADRTFDGKATEEVYDLLPDEPEDDGQNPGGHGASLGQTMRQNIDPISDSDPQAQAKQDKLESKIDQADMQAQMSGQDTGNYPGELARFLDELHNPQLPWTTILQNYMSAYNKEDYTYARPNRRFMPDFYLPGLHSEGLDQIAVAIDTSGSVSHEDFMAFLSEVNDIKETLKPQLTTILDFDTEVKLVTDLGPDESVDEVEFKGGGGTALEPVFEHFAEKGDPKVLIVFSDLYCRQIEEEPDYDVIWVCIDNPSATVNFGELIHFSTADINKG